MARYVVTDMGSSKRLRSESGDELALPRYGVWDKKGRKPQVVDTSDDLSGLLGKYGLTERDVVKLRGASPVDEGAVASRVASRVAADSLIDSVIDKRDLFKLKSKVDEQTWDLAREVYLSLMRSLELSPAQREALNRLRMSISSNYAPAMHRNNIFKAAHSLGIRLPSSSF